MKTSKTLSLEIDTVLRVDKMKREGETFSAIVDTLIEKEYLARIKADGKKGK